MEQERLIKTIYQVAWKYVKAYQDLRFDVDELVNEVWILGRVQKSEDRYVVQRIHWDIQEYLRKRRIGGRRIIPDRVKIMNPISESALGSVGSEFDSAHKGFDTCVESEHDGFKEVETRDFLTFVYKFVNDRDAEMLDLMYNKDYTQADVARLWCRTRASVSRRHQKIMVELRLKSERLIA